MQTLTKSGRHACARDLLNESGLHGGAGIGVLFGVWRLVHAEIEGVRRDLSAQIRRQHPDRQRAAGRPEALLGPRRHPLPAATLRHDESSDCSGPFSRAGGHRRPLTAIRPQRAGGITRRAGAQAEDGAAVDTPGRRRLSGPFWGWVLLDQDRSFSHYLRKSGLCGGDPTTHPLTSRASRLRF